MIVTVENKIEHNYVKELRFFRENKIISKINEPTEFANTFTLIKKENKKLVIALDSLHKNSCLLRQHFPLPTSEKISSKVNNATVFTILDASKTFWKIQLSEDSSKLSTTFQSSFGRYKFNRLPNGIKTAPEIFIESLKKLLRISLMQKIDIDDILICAETDQEM